MQQVELSRSQFYDLAERLSNEKLHEGGVLLVTATLYALYVIDCKLEIEFAYRADKHELYEMVLDLTMLSNNIRIG